MSVVSHVTGPRVAGKDHAGDLFAFVWIAATTGARKGEVLPRKWTQVFLEGSSPHIYIPRSKNGRAKRLPLAEEVIEALKRLPSYGQDESVFPADRANGRFKGKRDHIWDLRKPFQAACQRAGIKDLRIHDLRHMAASIPFLERVPDAIIRQLTGHRSRELERYEQLSPVLKRKPLPGLRTCSRQVTHLLTHKIPRNPTRAWK
jgi:integrase